MGSQVQDQNVWSPVYVNAMVERGRDADGNPANGLEERLYVEQAHLVVGRGVQLRLLGSSRAWSTDR